MEETPKGEDKQPQPQPQPPASPSTAERFAKLSLSALVQSHPQEGSTSCQVGTVLSGNVGVLTSGGDAQGMNAAVRGVVRTALQRGVRVYGICEGYKGLIDNEIIEMKWTSVSGILEKGGTSLGTARCLEFMKWEGLKKGALTLIQHGIDKLVVIGGDGSLTGANRLRTEWPKLVAELRAEKLIGDNQAEHPLNILGMVGSIDNDMFGTDMTIGADSALHRIVSAIDCIGSTAASHKRSFVIEVMGRNCGWLALTAAIATGADYVFFPEDPPEKDVWQKRLCNKLEKARDMGRRMSTVVVAEGAIDSDGTPITAEAVKKLIEQTLGLDTRVTILGHVQRGGCPSAYDRIMSTQLGAQAVSTLYSTDPDAPKSDLLVGVRGASITLNPLMECVRNTKAVAELIKEKKFAEAQALRGKQFIEAREVFYTTSTAVAQSVPSGDAKKHCIAIMHAGAGSPGMNNAVRTAVRCAVDRGHKVLGVYMGFNGLLEGDLREVNWASVSGWSSIGGALLGTSRKVPKSKADSKKMAEVLERFQVTSLIIIGGWEALEGSLRMDKHSHLYPILGLPKVLIPASISNNIPGTEFSVGSDTALNSIVEAVDKIRQSAESYGRVIIVEVMGSHCGYLALMSALATGAETVYLPEEGISLERLQKDCAALVNRFKNRGPGTPGGVGLVILNEKASKLYDVDFLKSVFSEESEGVFSVRRAVLGHLQQGGEPSPGDRIRSTKMASYGIRYLDKWEVGKNGGSIVIGEVGGETVTVPLQDIPSLSDLQHRRPAQQWWLPLRSLLDELSTPKSFSVFTN